MKNFYRGILSLVVALVLLSLTSVHSQSTMPDTDIYLVSMKWQGSNVTFGKAENITNREGYDNRPSFTRDAKNILYSSVRADGQSDIYNFDISSKAISRITQTPESEFSPTLRDDGQYYSCVRVERDSSQRLNLIPVSASERDVQLGSMDSVGYYCWIDHSRAAIFQLPAPFTLSVVNWFDGSRRLISDSVGRCIQKIPQQDAISFVRKVSEKYWIIERLDTKSLKVTQIVQTLVGSEDYVWTPSGILLMGKESKLYRYDPKHDKTWIEIADFATQGIKTFYRLAISPDASLLAVVVYSGVKP